MEEREKLIEIILKLFRKDHTIMDELEVLGHSVIELTINNPEEKRKAKLMLLSAKEEAEKRFNNSKNKNIN